MAVTIPLLLDEADLSFENTGWVLVKAEDKPALDLQPSTLDFLDRR